MRLTKIEMIGFKSFVEKTQIPINEGLTAIVGPNGCGKSNIADAVRWVIGEQSAKTLRGERMEDVIFSGSPKRKATGYAEVTLTLAKTNGHSGNGDTPAGKGSTPQEIEITRRLYRSGESEYLLNKTPCRLKDIGDLLMEGGLGSKTYALIEQGRVEEVVSMKPAERRVLLEEAAGIMKYKNQKRIAQGKIEASRVNLERVEDILAEIERQLGSLERQAKKARRYQALNQELRSLELAALYEEISGHQEQERALAAQHETQKGEEVRERSTWNVLLAQREELSLKESQAQNSLSQKREDLYKAQNLLNQEEGELSWEREREKSLAQKIQEAESRLNLLTNLLRELESQSRQEERGLEETAAGLKEREAELLALAEKRQEITLRLRMLRTEQEGQKKKVFEEALSLSEQKNQLTSLEERKRDLAKRKGRHQETHAEVEAQKESLENKGKELEEQKQRLEQEQSTLEEEQGRLEARRNELTQTTADLESQRGVLKEELAALTAQQETLQELEDKLEGCLPGTQALWEAKDQEPGLAGLLAPVAQDIICDPALEKAYAALLGEILGGLWIADRQSLWGAVEFLNRQTSGRALLVPLDLLSSPPAIPLPSLEGVVGWAQDLLIGQGERKEALARLLSGALIVKDLKAALEVRAKTSAPITVATLAGELLAPSGALWVGGKEVHPLLSRKRKLEELKKPQEEKEGRLRVLETGLAEIKAELADINSTLDKLEQKEEELSGEKGKILQEESLLKSEGQRLLRQEGFLRQEELSLEEEAQSLSQQEARLIEKVAALQRVMEEKEERLKALERELEALLPQEEEFMQKENQHSVEVAKLEERKGQAQREVQRLTREREKTSAEQQNLAAEKEKLEADLQAVAINITQKEEGLVRKMEALGAHKEELGRLEDSYAEIKQQKEAVELSLKDQEKVLEARVAQVKELELARTRVEVTLSHLLGRLTSEYQLSWEELQKSPPVVEASEEPLASRLTAIKNKIDNLGLVNMAALEEFEEEQKRYQFLCSQRDDILSSIDSLNQVITKMDEASKTLFQETFAAVNQHFGEVYQRLFSGGQARLLLVDPQDLLDSGVEIEAQPPGKNLQNISLLSGGEKALASLALLFSLFLTKPAPFCILDEADAPLDDVNVERYLEIMRELAQSAQFIIITHNKRTMEWADILYGVTMEEPGVSKVISVKLNGNNGKKNAPEALVAGQ